MKTKISLALILFLCLAKLNSQNSLNADTATISKAHDPSSSVNIIVPNGFALGKGNFYYRNSDVLLNSFGYGITRNININAVIDLYSTVKTIRGTSKTPTFALLPQYNFNVSEKIHAGLGFVYTITETRLTEYNSVLPVLSFNYGNKDNYIGMNLAYGFFDVTNVKTQVYSLFLQLKTAEKWRFLSEYIYFENGGMLNVGLKHLSQKSTISFGLNNFIINKFGVFPLPFFIVTFGNKRKY